MARKKRAVAKALRPAITVFQRVETQITHKSHGTFTVRAELDNSVYLEAPCGSDTTLPYDMAREVAKAVLAITGE